jgi:transposase
MIYVRPLTEAEHHELRRMTRQEIGRVSQRAQMILLSGQKRTVPEIATLFATSRATVRYLIRRFEAHGPSGLYDNERSGRPRRATAAVQESLVRLIQNDPQQAGYLATFWTVAMLVLALVQQGMSLSSSSVRSTLQTLGLRWGRPRLGMPKKVDPEKAQKQWAIVQAVIAAGPEAAILYADESRVQLLPLLRMMWHWVGQQIRVPTPGTNVTRALFGALNIRTGQWSYLIREHLYKEDFILFLEHLLTVYPSGPIILVVDNYSSHTAGVVVKWLADHPRLQVHYLPKYCSHLNPVESIWLRLKGQIAANRLYGSMQVLLDCINAFFQAMAPEQALRWAAE